jgi:hypothetical protein
LLVFVTYYISRCVQATPRAAASALARVVGQFEILSPPGQAATVELDAGRFSVLPLYWHESSFDEPSDPLVTARVSFHLHRAWPPASAVLEVVPWSLTKAEVGLRQVGGELKYFGLRRRCQFFELEHDALDFLTAEMESWVAARQSIGQPASPSIS